MIFTGRSEQKFKRNDVAKIISNMIRRFFDLTLIFLTSAVLGQTPNFDESKVGKYVLPDPLMDGKGNHITTKAQWLNTRRPEILDLFKAHVYGELPGPTKGIHFKVTNVDKNALGGMATRKEITVFFTPAQTGPSMDVLLFLPNHVNKPVPVFIGLNYFGNHSIHTDPGIRLSKQWMRESESYKIVNNKATEGSRGVHTHRWPVEMLLANGYGVATAYYGDLEPDHEDGWKEGIRNKLQQELKVQPTAWGAIGAWAWGLSRIQDYLETDTQVNAKQIIITGHSRLGKAALWSAANDTRFAIVIANDAGEGGSSLARRNYGETISEITKNFPYWFHSKYATYGQHVEELPVDQHMLMALMAPRPLYIASAADDQWADPKGEYLALVNAGPVYNLFGKIRMLPENVPALNAPIFGDVGYHIRDGKHDIILKDWTHFVTFCDMHMKEK